MTRGEYEESGPVIATENGVFHRAKINKYLNKPGGGTPGGQRIVICHCPNPDLLYRPRDWYTTSNQHPYPGNIAFNNVGEARKAGFRRCSFCYTEPPTD